MTSTFCIRQRISAFAAAALLAAAGAVAAPGAHGPNGEHLDGAGGNAAALSNAPRMEAKSELFEVVVTVAGGELSMLIDRFATNEPVLDATVEIETGTLKTIAKFHADHGDYAVADEAFMRALAQPGEHALVITVQAGADSDLLDGVIKVEAAHVDHAQDDHAHELVERWVWVAGAAVLLVAGAAAWIWRRRSASPEAVA